MTLLLGYSSLPTYVDIWSTLVKVRHEDLWYGQTIFLSQNSRLNFSRCVDRCVCEIRHVLVIILLLKKEYSLIGYVLLWNNVNKKWQTIISFKNWIPIKEWASSFFTVEPWKYVGVHTSFHSYRLLTLELGFKPWSFKAQNLRHGMNLATINASCWFS